MQQPPKEPVYVVTPKSGKGKGVLVLHAWWGLNDVFKDVCERLANEGCVALAPDLFEGKTATTIEEAKKLRAARKKEPSYQTILRAMKQLQNHETVRGSMIGVIGFSMGAHWAWWLAAQPDLPIAATVTFYGARASNFAQSQSSFLCHFAETDDYVSASSIKRLEKNLKSAGKDYRFYTYPNTTHWFFEKDQVDAYNAKAARLAWERTIAFLKETLG